MIQLAVALEAIERAPTFWKAIFLRAHLADIRVAIVTSRQSGKTPEEVVMGVLARLDDWDLPPAKIIVAGTGGEEAAALAVGDEITWWVGEGLTTEGIARITADMLSHGDTEAFARGSELVVLRQTGPLSWVLRATARPGECGFHLAGRIEKALAGEASAPVPMVRAEAPPRLAIYAWSDLRPWLRRLAPDVLAEVEELLGTRGILRGEPRSPGTFAGSVVLDLSSAPMSDDACDWLCRALGSSRPRLQFGEP